MTQQARQEKTTGETIDYNAVHVAAVRGLTHGVGALPSEALTTLADARLASQPSTKISPSFKEPTAASAIRCSQKQATLWASHGISSDSASATSRATRFEGPKIRTENPLLKDNGVSGKVLRRRGLAQRDTYMQTHDLDSFFTSLRQKLLVKQPENPWELICEEAMRREEESEQPKTSLAGDCGNDQGASTMPQECTGSPLREGGGSGNVCVKVKHRGDQTDGFFRVAEFFRMRDELIQKDAEIAWLQRQIKPGAASQTSPPENSETQEFPGPPWFYVRPDPQSEVALHP